MLIDDESALLWPLIIALFLWVMAELYLSANTANFAKNNTVLMNSFFANISLFNQHSIIVPYAKTEVY